MNSLSNDEFVEYLCGKRGIVTYEDDDVEIKEFMGRWEPRYECNLKITLPPLKPYISQPSESSESHESHESFKPFSSEWVETPFDSPNAQYLTKHNQHLLFAGSDEGNEDDENKKQIRRMQDKLAKRGANRGAKRGAKHVATSKPPSPNKPKGSQKWSVDQWLEYVSS